MIYILLVIHRDVHCDVNMVSCVLRDVYLTRDGIGKHSNCYMGSRNSERSHGQYRLEKEQEGITKVVILNTITRYMNTGPNWPVGSSAQFKLP